MTLLLLGWAISVPVPNLVLFGLTATPEKLDLSGIKYIAPKGRVQDRFYNGRIVLIDDLISRGKESVPRLISLLEDDSPLPMGVVDYWRDLQVGDVALIILMDFFADPDGKASIPGMSWNEIFKDAPTSLDSEARLRRYVEQNGKGSLKRLWQETWSKYEKDVYWDFDLNCFVLRHTPTETQSQ